MREGQTLISVVQGYQWENLTHSSWIFLGLQQQRRIESVPEPNLLILLQSQNSDSPSTAIIVEMHLDLTLKSCEHDLLPGKLSRNQRPYFQKTRQYVAPSHGSGSFRPPARESSSLFRQIAICNQAGCGESRATSQKRDNQTWKESLSSWCWNGARRRSWAGNWQVKVRWRELLFQGAFSLWFCRQEGKWKGRSWFAAYIGVWTVPN